MFNRLLLEKLMVSLIALLVVMSLSAVSAEAVSGPILFVEPNVATLEFGSTTVGTPVTRSVVLRNVGDEDLIIYSITAPTGFSLIGAPSSFTKIIPGIGYRMEIRLDAENPGSYGGPMSYQTNMLGSYNQSVEGFVEDDEPPPPQTQVTVVQPNADAHVVQETPNKNVGKQAILRIRSPNSGAGRHTFLRFNVPAITGTIESAVLRIRPQSNTISTASIYDANMGWGEKTITWNNWQNGGTTFTYLRNVGPLAGEQWHEINVEEAVQRVSANGGTITIGITTSSSTAGFRFYSRESNFTPTLEITTR